jgi:RNA recognition motif-containing protein
MGCGVAEAWADYHGYSRNVGVQVTEEQLASLFKDCGQVVDCRVCGDANSAMRFAFIEFVEEEAVTKVS